MHIDTSRILDLWIIYSLVMAHMKSRNMQLSFFYINKLFVQDC
jgi:hypothetical protein